MENQTEEKIDTQVKSQEEETAAVDSVRTTVLNYLGKTEAEWNDLGKEDRLASMREFLKDIGLTEKSDFVSSVDLTDFFPKPAAAASDSSSKSEEQVAEEPERVLAEADATQVPEEQDLHENKEEFVQNIYPQQHYASQQNYTQQHSPSAQAFPVDMGYRPASNASTLALLAALLLAPYAAHTFVVNPIITGKKRPSLMEVLGIVRKEDGAKEKPKDYFKKKKNKQDQEDEDLENDDD